MRVNLECRFIGFACAVFLLLFPQYCFAAALSGTGCTTDGDCVVSASQTIDHNGIYYFNSLTINSGVVVAVNYTSSVNKGGGSVRFYVANDANISGSITALGGTGPNGYSLDGGGYGCWVGACGAGGGVIIIKAKNIRIASTGVLNAAGNASASYGGGSGGTIKLYGGMIDFRGSLIASGGSGGSGNGGGAGGSLVFMPFSVSYLKSGTMNFNGGTSSGGGGTGGGSGRSGGNGSSAGGGGSGGNDAGTGGGIANSSRNIKIYNSFVPAGSTFSITSTGSTSGLMDAYLTSNSSKFTSLTETYMNETILVSSSDFDMLSVPGTNFTIVNASNQSQSFASLTTNSNGIALSTIGLSPNSSYNVITTAASNNGYVSFSYINYSASQQSSIFLKTSSTIPKLLLRWLNSVVYSPSNLPLSGKTMLATIGDSYKCAGNTDASGACSCLLAKTAVDGSNSSWG